MTHLNMVNPMDGLESEESFVIITVETDDCEGGGWIGAEYIVLTD